MKTPQEIKEAHYAAGIIRGLTKKQAALEAGYSLSVAEHTIAAIHARPAVQAVIKGAQSELRSAAVYDVTSAMAEAGEAITFAKENKNSMAFVKAVELRAKLSGLLIERIDARVAVVDVNAAIREAKARVHNWNNPAALVDPFS